MTLADQSIEMVVDPLESGIFSTADASKPPVIEVFAAPEGTVYGSRIHLKFNFPGVIPTPEVKLVVSSEAGSKTYYLEADWKKAIFLTDAIGRDGDEVILEGNLDGVIDPVDDTGATDGEPVPIKALVAVRLDQRNR
ncbi:MAG: hypothetical protein E4G91_11055 [Candidatus Zixiibacteriota bacterium]|nr:MAG: hypothetical protein E4G91_11055 [candidate division Zixibacteria bacterium]